MTTESTSSSEQLAITLNRRARKLCLDVVDDPHLATRLGINVVDSPSTLLDFGTSHTGTLEAGILLAKICLADLADVRLVSDVTSGLGLPRVQISTDAPLAACIAAQYAGWPFSDGDYFAMCSGPVRMVRGHEELIQKYDLHGTAKHVVGIFETNKLPGDSNLESFANACNLDPAHATTVCVARTASLPGTIQVVARSVETTMHKLFEIGFDLRKVKNAIGSAPLPPIAGDDLTSLGWTNDAILYGSLVNLWVQCEDDELDQLGPKIPSSASTDFGRPFLEIFNEYDRDFYKVDKLLFSPASVVINNLASGRSFKFGEIRNDLLMTSFGLN